MPTGFPFYYARRVGVEGEAGDGGGGGVYGCMLGAIRTDLRGS